MINDFKAFLKDRYNIVFVIVSVLLMGVAFLPIYNDVIYKIFPQNALKQSILFKVIIFSYLFVLLPFYYVKRDFRYILIIFTATFFSCVVIAFKTHNVFYSLGGDIWYLNALVTQNKHYADWLIDSSIKDIPSYISPLYFFVVGKLAWVFKANPSEALICSSFAGAILMPLMYYSLLKRNFELTIVIISVIVGCVFFNYELILKPYQSLSAVLCLIFYYKLLPRVQQVKQFKTIIWPATIGIILFLLYYYHFVYLAIAFFVDIAFRRFVNLENRKEVVLSRFAVYAIIFVFGFFLFLLPNLLATAKAGSSHKIFFGSTEKLEIVYLGFPLILGLFDIFRNLKSEFAFRTLVLISSLTILFVLNLFIEVLLDYNVHTFKILHLIPLILLPHAVSLCYNFVKSQIDANYQNLIQAFFLSILLFYAINDWATYCMDHKIDSNQSKGWSNAGDHIYSHINLKNKVVFFPTFTSDLEYGAYVPCFRFMPVSNDFGSPASRIKERGEFMKSLDSVKNNPAAFASKLMNQSEFEKIDYLLWRDRLVWSTVAKMGEPAQLMDFPLNKSCLSQRYFAKANPNVNDLYRLKYENNFINKPSHSLTFLEKVAKGDIKQDYFKRFLKELKSNPKLYTSEDLKDAIFYLETSHNLSAQQFDSIYTFMPSGSKKRVFEVEEMRGPNININKVDVYASNGFARTITPQDPMYDQTLYFGPYEEFAKGKYELWIYLKANLDKDVKVFSYDIASGQAGKVFTSGEISANKIFSEKGFKVIRIPVEFPQRYTDVEIRGFYYNESGVSLSVDKYELIAQ